MPQTENRPEGPTELLPPMKSASIDDVKKGTLGYVNFDLPRYHAGAMILCGVDAISRNRKRIAIMPVAGDRTCIWIDLDDFYLYLT